MALFAVTAFLLFLIQCLRLFDALVERGQSLVTLLGQALLGMPALGTGFLYVCLGIGLGRALRSLQASSELQVVHVGGLLPAMLRALTLFIGSGALVLLLLAHVVNPLSQRALNEWSAGIAADLVSRSMIPHKIVQIADSVSITIGARDGAGNITDFFADDHRAQSERTYFAKSAIITRDAKGFVLRMQDGAIQQMNAQKRLSQVSFARYDLPMDQLTGAAGGGGAGGEDTSFGLIASAMANGWDPGIIDALVRRNAEAIRVIAICLLVFAIAGFPSGSRRPTRIPIELLVLGAAFVERGLGTFISLPPIAGPAPGAALMIVAAVVVLLFRLRVFSPLPRRAVA